MKYVALFPKGGTEVAIRAEQSLRDAGVEKIYAHPLSRNAQSEVDQEVFLTRWERSYTWIGIFLGALVGIALAYVQLADLFYFPIFLPLFAAGQVGMYLFWTVLGAMIGGLIGPLAGLLSGVGDVEAGEEMLIVYAPANQRRKITRLVHDRGGKLL